MKVEVRKIWLHEKHPQVTIVHPETGKPLEVGEFYEDRVTDAKLLRLSSRGLFPYPPKKSDPAEESGTVEGE